MRNDDIAELEISLQSCASELGELQSRFKHVNAMANCLEHAGLCLMTDKPAQAMEWIDQAMKHFAEWEK